MPGGAAALAAFHERLWRRSQTSVAFTCLESVADRLTAAGVPVSVIRPTGSAIRSALRTATLLGAHRRLEEAQLAVVVVEVPTLRETARRPAPRHSREELRLDRPPVPAAGSPADAGRGQPGGRSHASWSPRPAGRCRERPTASGCRRSPTGRAANWASRSRWASAWAGPPRKRRRTRGRLARSHAAPGARGFALDREGYALVPAPRAPAVGPGGQAEGPGTLSRLADQLPDDDGAHVVDAETAGPAAWRHPPDRPPAAPYPGRRGSGLAAAAEPDPAAGPPTPVLPDQVTEKLSPPRPS